MSRTPAWEASYRELLAARQRPFMRTAYGVLGSWVAAEDAVQTTFARLYVPWPRIQSGAVDTCARRTLVRVRLFSPTPASLRRSCPTRVRLFSPSPTSP